MLDKFRGGKMKGEKLIKTKRGSNFKRSLGVLCALATGTFAFASDLAIEEIIVTGTKRAQAQQELALSVSTITEKEVKNTFRNDVFALGQLAPNVTLTSQTGFRAIAGGMRGTGFDSILVTKDASVGVVVDDFAFNHTMAQSIAMFDIEQVEMFRGPQGTLFGKNTTGGAINFTTKKPVLGETFGDLEITYGEHSSNDGAIEKLNGAINFPLGDKAAVRITGIYDYTDGYYTNGKQSGPVGTFVPGGADLTTNGGTFYPDPYLTQINGNYYVKGDGDEIGGIDVLALKLKLRYRPNDNYTLDLTLENIDDSSETVAAANLTPLTEGYNFVFLGFPGIGDADPLMTGQSNWCHVWGCNDRGHDTQVQGVYLTQTYTTGNYAFKSITGMVDREEILSSTYVGDAYNSLYDASRNTVRDQFQQEFRVVSDFDGPFNFVAGAAFYKDDMEFVVFGGLGFLSLFGLGTGFYDLAEIQASTQDRESSALYFDVTYELSEQLTISAGVRHSEDEKSFTRYQYGAPDASSTYAGFATINASQYQGPFTNPLPREAFAFYFEDSKDFEADTFRFVVDYQLNENVMLYGSVATGFIAGGFSETCGSVEYCTAYDDEENTNIELGFKSDLLDGKLRLNGAIFETEYENLQRDTVINKLVAGADFQETISVNEGISTAQGIEIEATLLPTDNFRIDAFLGLLDHDYDEFSPSVNYGTFVNGASTPGQNVSPDMSGLTPPFSPETNYGVTLTYSNELSSGAGLTLSMSMHHRDEMEISPFPANAQGLDSSGNFIVQQKALTQAERRTLVDAFVTYEPSDRVALTLWGKNLTDEIYQISSNPVGTLWNFSTFGEPRSVGVRASVNF